MIDPKVLKELRNALRTHTLLYVEDNISLNKQATQLFQKFFDTVYSATDSESGLELFKKHHSAVVISEIHMLNMDGFTLAREILQIDSETKIILMMSRDDPRYLHEALKIGAFDCLAKPISVQMIVD
ncbi:MAG: response regulator, partial [Sulfuricurvum sp.]|nr:response regulator [Sulfuricurvum sp.]